MQYENNILLGKKIFSKRYTWKRGSPYNQGHLYSGQYDLFHKGRFEDPYYICIKFFHIFT